MKITYAGENKNDSILQEIKHALNNIQWGSLEIFIQDSKVVQITERNIKKMKAQEVQAQTGKKAVR
jgi:hypothetical protein